MVALTELIAVDFNILQPNALLCMANNTCIVETFTHIRDRFNKLYRSKVSTCISTIIILMVFQAFKHHFLSAGMEEERFESSLASLTSLIGRYSELERAAGLAARAPRLEVV